MPTRAVRFVTRAVHADSDDNLPCSAGERPSSILEAVSISERVVDRGFKQDLSTAYGQDAETKQHYGNGMQCGYRSMR
jgi:hypothetical protein